MWAFLVYFFGKINFLNDESAMENSIIDSG